MFSNSYTDYGLKWRVRRCALITVSKVLASTNLKMFAKWKQLDRDLHQQEIWSFASDMINAWNGAALCGNIVGKKSTVNS